MSWLRLGWPDILRCLGVQVGAANTPAEHAEAEAESTRMEAIRTDESPRPSSWCLLARHQTIVGKCKYLRFTARWPNSRSGRRTSACRAQPPPPGPASWWAPPGSAETTWATQGGQGLPNGGQGLQNGGQGLQNGGQGLPNGGPENMAF